MRFVIKHEIKGRLRVHILQSRMSFAQADTLQYYLDGQNNIVSAKIQERTLDVTVVYTGSREEALKTLENFTYQGTEVPENYLANSGREMNREYKDQLINKVVMHYGIRLFLPMDIRSVITTVKSFKYPALVFTRNTDSIVFDTNLHIFSQITKMNTYRSILFIILDTIVA